MRVGETIKRKGDITSLNFVAAKQPMLVERVLGFAPGRLARGYGICLLLDMVQIDEFRLGGLTLSSGGREGLPAATWAADGRRRSIDDRVTAEYDDGGKKLRQIAQVLINRTLGSLRTVKIVPVTDHDASIGPAAQYPPGEGAPQWTLVEPKRFLVAGMVDSAARFTGTGLSADLGPRASYDDRARVLRFLETARA